MPNFSSFSWAFTVGIPSFGLSGTVIAEKKFPIAIAYSDPENTVIGAVIRLNGQRSYDPGVALPRTANDASTEFLTDIVTILSANFSPQDLGRVLELTGQDAGEYRIVLVIGLSQVKVKRSDGTGVSFLGSTGQQWTISDKLYYAWRFTSVPVGSVVGQESFRLFDTDLSLVSFSPDIIGEYNLELIVSNGYYLSEPSQVHVSVRSIMVPHGRGIIPDGKFIWSYIRDVWTQVDGKEWFETLWSALIQITGSELLKLYQNDFSKSIRDIQDQYQRRWLSYEPELKIVEDDSVFYLGNHCAGTAATTFQVGLEGQAILLPTADVPTVWAASTAYAIGAVVFPIPLNEDDSLYFRCISPGISGGVEPDWVAIFGEVTSDGAARWELTSLTKEVVISQGTIFPNSAGSDFSISYDPLQPKNVRTFKILGPTVPKTGYKLDTSTPPPDPIPNRVGALVSALFTFQSKTWTAVGQVGDVFHFPTGPNAGFYRILSTSGPTVTVDKAPLSFSDAVTILTYQPNVYRPVGYKIPPSTDLTTTVFAVPYEPGVNDVSVLAAGRVITVGSQAYTILRSSIDTSQMIPMVVIAVDGGAVLSRLKNLNWRAPHTLISSSQNFEELGVSSGDLLTLTVTNDRTQTAVDVVAQVIGVDRFRIGFVLTDEDTTPGVLPPIPDKTPQALSNGFSIGVLGKNQTGALTYASEALTLKNVLNSQLFKRAYWNKELTPKSDIKVDSRTFRIHPKSVIRNKTLPVDSELRSVPLLQEWIVQPQLSLHDGKIFQAKDGKEFELSHKPVVLVENSDFVIDDENAVEGELKFDTGSDIIFIEGGNFIDRGIVPGDKFIIDAPSTLADEFYIAQVLDEDTLQLTTAVPLYVLGVSVIASVRIQRKRTGHFLRLTPGAFSAKSPAPARLWGEVSLFDNASYVEDNFGILVALTREDLESISSDVSYRQAVAGLMYAYTQGSAVEKVRLGAQILLGLPFAEHRGIIRSIEHDYRLDASGNPSFGRILIEDIASDGTLQGTLRVYLFPIDDVSELAGIETSPVTEKTYAIGDTVELFAILAKGVEVIDYVSKPDWPLSAVGRLQQFHTVRLRANDIVFSLKELTLLSPFLRKITPSYVSAIITTAIELADDVEILDDTTIGLRNISAFVDNPYFGLASPLMFDAKNYDGFRLIFLDDDVYWLRKWGEGLVSTVRSGAPGSPQTLTLAAGGVVTPVGGEGPVTKVGADLLMIIDGDNQGLYTIDAATNTTVRVSDAPTYGFQPSSNKYAILRRVVGELRRGTLSSAASVASMEVGVQADGVAPGDLLVVDRSAGAYSRHLVRRVGPHADAPALLAGEVEVVPALGTLAAKSYTIFREPFVEAPYHEATTLTSSGTAYTAFSSQRIQGLLEPGDQLEVNGGAFGRLSVLDPFRKYFVPVLPAGAYTVKVCKKGHATTPVGLDYLGLMGPKEVLDMALVGAGAGTTALSKDVTLVDAPNPALLNILPADFLALLSGADSLVDVGYGPGLYPIVEVTATLVRLAADLTATGSFLWKIIRRRQ